LTLNTLPKDPSPIISSTSKSLNFGLKFRSDYVLEALVKEAY